MRLNQKFINISMSKYGNKHLHAIYLSKEKFENCMELLLIGNGDKTHYVYIEDFNRLIYRTAKHKGKVHFCLNCLQCFSTK